jgi:hypothetical protein
MSTKNRTVIGLGDFQINRHDPLWMKKTLRCIKDVQPDIICLTGDESDNSSLGRHSRGLAEEFESNLQEQLDITSKYFGDLRAAAPNARIHMAYSNHVEWFTRAIETRLPGFRTLRRLQVEELYDLNDHGIEYQREIFEFLPGYLLAHGHQFNFTSKSHMNQGTAAVQRMGKSLLAGHCHQAGMRTVFIGHEGRGRTHVYVNAGCGMDFNQAMSTNGEYIAGASPDWSHALVYIERVNETNHTQLVVAQDNKFRLHRVSY